MFLDEIEKRKKMKMKNVAKYILYRAVESGHLIIWPSWPSH